MNKIKKLAYKWRYNPLPRLLLNALKRLGITILPYYLFKRELAETRQEIRPGKLRLKELLRDDIHQIAEMELVHASQQEFAERLQRGHRCFGLYDGELLLAYNWQDYSVCSFRNDNFPLAADEAYGYDIFTVQNRRGENLANLLIGLVSQQLESEGIRNEYSVVDYYNRPSLRVAEKIGCVPQRLSLYIGLFGLWEWNLCLQQLASPASLCDVSSA